MYSAFGRIPAALKVGLNFQAPLKRASARSFRILTVTMAAAHVTAGSAVDGVVSPLPVSDGAVRGQLEDRLHGAFYGLLIGDALSAPVHWYYNPADIA